MPSSYACFKKTHKETGSRNACGLFPQGGDVYCGRICADESRIFRKGKLIGRPWWTILELFCLARRKYRIQIGFQHSRIQDRAAL
jgi:hypothetical protein